VPRYPVLVKALWFLVAGASLFSAPLTWSHLPGPLQSILAMEGLSAETHPAWLASYSDRARQRLADGAAEHVTYFLLQTRLLPGPPLNPTAQARAFLQSLPLAERKAFLSGQFSAHPLPPAVQTRIDAFRQTFPQTPRHRLLVQLAAPSPLESQVQNTFRFLLQLANGRDANDLYQRRGLSADPYRPSLTAVSRGLEWLRKHRPLPVKRVLLAGPGAELGSRFGLDDAAPVRSPQPAALLSLLRSKPDTFDCVDIRPEVTATLAAGPCKSSTLDLVSTLLPANRYDLIVATNLFVYLSDVELAHALTNIAQSLRPRGCLIHNDERFAARLFSEAAGIPNLHFESVPLPAPQGRPQLDRVAIHCKSVN
jgi:hypothetical protein